MSKISKLNKYLHTSGSAMTAKQITHMFGLQNPYEAVRKLRNAGVCVYSTPTYLADGALSNKYYIGKPKPEMIALAAGFGASLFRT